MSARLWLLREAVVTNRRIDPKANFESFEESDEALRIKEVLQVGEGEFVTVANPHGDYRSCSQSSLSPSLPKNFAPAQYQHALEFRLGTARVELHAQFKARALPHCFSIRILL